MQGIHKGLVSSTKMGHLSLLVVSFDGLNWQVPWSLSTTRGKTGFMGVGL